MYYYKQGQICYNDSDCPMGQYCGGPGICIAGQHGRRPGDYCQWDTQCMVGLKCAGNKCMRTGPVMAQRASRPSIGFRVDNRPGIPVPSFTNQYIYRRCEDGTYLYLEASVNKGDSNWVKNPTQVFTYNAEKSILTCNIVGSSYVGFVGVRTDGCLIVRESYERITIVADVNGMTLKDSYGNVLGIGTEKHHPLALFNDPIHYHDGPSARIIPCRIQMTSG